MAQCGAFRYHLRDGDDVAPLADRLPHEVATAALEFITGQLLDDPGRVGKALGEELIGIHSARLGRQWRVLYEIDESTRTVIVLDIRHRSCTDLGEKKVTRSR